MSIHERTEMLIGREGTERLNSMKVLVFGVGGVGGFVCESLARAGVGCIDVVDNDVVAESNINRQIIATHSTIGMEKVSVMKKRIEDINPKCVVTPYSCFYLPDDEETVKLFNFGKYNYIIDAVDTVAAKVDIICKAKEVNVPIISSMGTGNKLDNGRLQIADISKTTVCPLAKAVRKELRKRGVEDVKVLFSTEEPIKTGLRVPGSISFVPSTAGLLIGGEVIRDLLK